MHELVYTAKFVRKARKLPIPIKKQLVRVKELLKEDVYNPILKTHKLTGVLKGYYALSINYSYRVIFSIEKDGSVVLIDVGDHSVY